MNDQLSMQQWLDNVLNTENDELSYDELEGFLPALAEAEAENRTLSPEVTRKIRAVLKQFPDLQEQYDVLVDVLHQEAADDLPTADELLAEFEPEEAPLPFAAD